MAANTRAFATAVATAALALGACRAARLVTVPSGAQPADAKPTSVGFPPPPAKIEEIPLAHHAANGCVWRDGFWDWTGRRWEWQGGRAVLPPAGCHFAEAKLEWSTDSLSFYRPAWYRDAHENGVDRKACLETACIPPAKGEAPP